MRLNKKDQNQNVDTSVEQTDDTDEATRRWGTVRLTFFVCAGLSVVVFLLWWIYSSHYIVTLGHVNSPTYDVRAPMSGTMTNLLVHEGDTVKRNQTLGTLYKTHLDPSTRTSIRSLQNSEITTYLELKQKQEQRKRLNERLREERKKKNRLKKLYLLQAISREKYRKQVETFRDLKSELRQTREAIQQLSLKLSSFGEDTLKPGRSDQRKEASPTLKENRTPSSRQQRLKQRMRTQTLTAPVRGEITSIRRKEGEHAADGDLVMTIRENSKIFVTAYVQARELPSIHSGQTVQLTTTGERERTFEGTITTQLDRIRLPETGVQRNEPQGSPEGLDETYVPIRIKPSAPPKHLRSGMIVRVRIARNESAISHLIPW